MGQPAEACLALLREQALLLQQHKVLPNVVALVAGESLTSSWWKQARAHDILRCLVQLTEDPNVLLTKLICGKVTFVHRRLWPATSSICCYKAQGALRA
jgi:hypothetical protein